MSSGLHGIIFLEPHAPGMDRDLEGLPEWLELDVVQFELENFVSIKEESNA